VLDSVVSPHSKRNYARALDDLFTFCAKPTSLPGVLVGVAGRHGVLVAFDDQCPAIGHGQDGRRGPSRRHPGAGGGGQLRSGHRSGIRPVPRVRLYGGGLYFPGDRTADVLRAWTAWHPSTPETMVTSIAVMRMPSMPEVAEPLRGKFLVSVRIAYNGTTADGERMIEPLRAVAPAVLDTVRDMSYAEVASIHNEPTDALPYYERGIMLREFPPQAQDKLIELVGPDAETDLVMAELRALGGAWDREPKVPNAVATRGLPYSLLGVSAGPLSEEEQLKMSVANLLDGMKPWQGARRYVNNLAPDEAADAAAIYGPERYERLASIKKTYDPANMFRLNHNVMPAT
jgi:hypothetical protein